MPSEIERKFLVISDEWRLGATGKVYRQGYLTATVDCSVRVRIAGAAAYLTVKGPTQGIQRLEYEYPIPVEDAQEMLLTLCHKPQIEKVRYCIAVGDLMWEVDEFLGDNAGLVMAEVELAHVDQPIDLPPWVGQEVSGDPRYYNSSLARHPYRDWGNAG